MGDSIKFAAVRGQPPSCHAWTKHRFLYPLISAIRPISTVSCPAEILKRAFDNTAAWLSVGETHPQRAPEAALALLLLSLSVTYLVACKGAPACRPLLQPRKKRLTESAKALTCVPARSGAGPAARLSRQGLTVRCDLSVGKRALEGDDGMLPGMLRAPAGGWRVGWWAPAHRGRAKGGGRGRGRAAITAVSVSTSCRETREAHGHSSINGGLQLQNYSGSEFTLQNHSDSELQLKEHEGCEQVQSHPRHLAAEAAGSGAPAIRSGHFGSLRSYVHRTELSSTRVKIHGVQPEMIPAGYRERIAAVVTAAGRQLEGVYIRRGCIELLVDTAHSIEGACPVLPAAPAKTLSPLAEALHREVQHLDVDKLVQSLQLPLEQQSSSQRHVAVVWECLKPGVVAATAACAAMPLGSGEHGGRDDDGGSHAAGVLQQLTLAAAATSERPGDLVVSPELTVWPRVVCTAAGPRGMPAVAAVGSAGRPVMATEPCTLADVAEASTSTGKPYTVTSASCDITAAAAIKPDAATAAESGADCGSTTALAVRIWWPLPPGSRKDEPSEVLVSARMGGTFLPVIWKWESCQVLTAEASAEAPAAMTQIVVGDVLVSAAATAPSIAVSVFQSPPGVYEEQNVDSGLAAATLQSLHEHSGAGGGTSSSCAEKASLVEIGANNPSISASEGDGDSASDSGRAVAALGDTGEGGRGDATLSVWASRGCLITGTCRIQDLPPSPGLILLQAYILGTHEEEEEGDLGCYTHLVPVLCVDDPLVTAEILHASGGAVGDGGGSGAAAAAAVEVDDEQAAGEVEEFLIDLGFFLSGTARSTAAFAAASGAGGGGAGNLRELEELGRHLYDWLSRTANKDVVWPATRARLRRELDTIAAWVRNLTPVDKTPVVASSLADSETSIESSVEDLILQISNLGKSSSEGDGGSGIDAGDGDVSRSLSDSGDPSSGGCGGGGDGADQGREHKPLSWVARSPGAAAVAREAASAPTAGAGGVDSSNSSRIGTVPARLGLSEAAVAAAVVDAMREDTSAGFVSDNSGLRPWRRRQGQRWWWSNAAVGATGAWACVNDMYGTLNDPGYQNFLTEYCAMQAPVLDIMFFLSVGSIVLRTWQEQPRWRQRPLPAFLSHVMPCLVTLATSVLSTLTRPLLQRPAWSWLVRVCMIPRYLSFCLGLALVAAGWPPPPAIAAYHQRCVSVLMGEGVVLSATVVIMPWPSLLLAALRVPAHVGVWLRVGAYKTVMDAVPPAILLACCSIVTNMLLHAVLVVQYHRRVRARRRVRSKAD